MIICSLIFGQDTCIVAYTNVNDTKVADLRSKQSDLLGGGYHSVMCTIQVQEGASVGFNTPASLSTGVG